MKILVTGSAGFIGYHLVKKLIESGNDVVGIDNINDYYDPELKFGRLADCGIAKENVNWHREVISTIYPAYRFIRMSIESKGELMSLCHREQFEIIIHLAAQAGVRYSILNPDAYAQSNLVSFLNILEVSRHNDIKHLVYASSSSVYGLNETMPFSVHDSVDHPISLYAASKKANELMAHTYSHLYNIPTSGLRFFTVYGPWGRPDMAYFLFANAISQGKPIQVFNNGEMKRDFTYVDDIVDGIISVANSPATPNKSWDAKKPDPATSPAPYRIYNIGNNEPVELMTFIKEIEKSIGKPAVLQFKEMQDGDVTSTWANIDDLIDNFNYQPKTSVSKGIGEFINWYKNHYDINTTS